MLTIMSAWKGNFDTGFTTVEFTSSEESCTFEKTNEWNELCFLSDNGYWTLTKTEVEVKAPTKKGEKEAFESQYAWFLTNCDGNGAIQIIKPRDDPKGRNIFTIESIASFGPYVLFDISHNTIPKSKKHKYRSVEMATYDLNASQYLLKAKLYNELSGFDFRQLVVDKQGGEIGPAQRLLGYVSLYPLWDHQGKPSFSARYAYGVDLLSGLSEGDGTWNTGMKSFFIDNVETIVQAVDAPKEIVDFWGDPSSYEPSREGKKVTNFRGLGIRQIE